jgi:hypothetical protein
MLFRRRPARATSPAFTRDDAFAAKPIATPTIERTARDSGGARIDIAMRPSGYQKWLLRIPDDATRRIELDAVGVEVYDQCDGRTSVRQIARRFAKQHQVDQREAEAAVANFIQMMMRKGLVSILMNKK